MPAVNLDDRIYTYILNRSLEDSSAGGIFAGQDTRRAVLETLSADGSQLKILTDDVLDGRYVNQAQYDRQFTQTAIYVCDCLNSCENIKKQITFGIAQKLINSVMKLLYISSYRKNYSVKHNFRFCHCPMDRQALDHVWKEYGKRGERTDLGRSADFHRSCTEEDFDLDTRGSRIMPRRYKLFQDALRNLAVMYSHAEGGRACPLEYGMILFE